MFWKLVTSSKHQILWGVVLDRWRLDIFYNYNPGFNHLKQQEKITNPICQTYSWNKDGLKLFRLRIRAIVDIHVVSLSKGPFILHCNCDALSHCTLLHINCDVTGLQCCKKVKFILTWNVKLRWLAAESNRCMGTTST